MPGTIEDAMDITSIYLNRIAKINSLQNASPEN